MPTKLRIARIFVDAAQAAKEFGDDIAYRAESEYAGQDVYFVLWDTSEELNLDRMRVSDNLISNCGMWLPDSERIYGTADLEVELVPPEKLKARKKQKAKAVRDAAEKVPGDEEDADDMYGGDDDGYGIARGRTAIPGARYGTSRSGTPWNRYM